MLTVKAKHATMLLTVSEVDGLSDGLEELDDEEEEMHKHPPAHPSVVMVSDLHLHMLGLGGVRWVLFFYFTVRQHPMGLLFLPQGCMCLYIVYPCCCLLPKE